MRDLLSRSERGQLNDSTRERELLRDFLTRWVEAAKATIRSNTYRQYKRVVNNHLIPALGHHRLADMRPEAIERFYADLRQLRSPRTVHHCHRILHRALEMAVKWGYVAHNVCDRVETPRVPRRELVPPTAEQVGKLLQAAEASQDPLFCLWMLAALTGARKGELLALQWKDVDFGARTLYIRRSMIRVNQGVPEYGEPKTEKSRRVISLDESMVTALRTHRSRQNEDRLHLGEAWADTDLIFASEVGTPLDQGNVTRRYKRALHRAGVSTSFRFHDLRHAAITTMLQSGEPVADVSEMVGHHSPTMTYGV